MSARTQRRGAAGFTLLEALIAMALMGLMLSVLATIAAQWLPNWNRGIARVQGNDTLALGLERLTADIAAAQFIPARGDRVQPVFNGESSSLTLVRTVLSPNERPGLELVRIADLKDQDGPALVRARAPFVPGVVLGNDKAAPKFADPVVLVRAPYRVTFAYAGDDRVWRASWRDELELPRAVKLTVRDAATGRTLNVSTATLIHAQVAAGCIAAKSVEDCREARLRQAKSGRPTTNASGLK